MGRFSTDKLNISPSNEGNYTVPLLDGVNLTANADGRWRSRPRGHRLFSDDDIRAIRDSAESTRALASRYNCSAPGIYYIKKRAVYCDVI